MASWAGIPEEILMLIVTYLQCFADRASVAAVCHDWRAAVRHLAAPPPRDQQLPWLLQPSGDAPSFASFLSGTRRRICLAEEVRQADRAFGSHDGGWIAIAADLQGPYAFVNILSPSGGSVPLPRTVSKTPFTRGDRPQPLAIRMVTLSGKPTSPDCIAAAHTADVPAGIVFCRPHVDRHWAKPLMTDADPIQDTLYHRGEAYEGFYAISSRGKLCVFRPRHVYLSTGKLLVMRQMVISFGAVARYLQPGSQSRMSTSITRYLVASRGKLLLVVRYSGTARGSTRQRTLHFKVFQMDIRPLPDNEGHTASWVELAGLDNRVLFVGRGCSRAFEAGKLTGFQEGSIYFLDDDAACAGDRLPMCVPADMGTYSMGEGMIVRPGLPTLRRTTGYQASSLYGPRDLMVRTVTNASYHILWDISSLRIVREAGNEEANSSASDSREHSRRETAVASVWPFFDELQADFSRPIWFLPSETE